MSSLTLQGSKNTATVFTHNIEETAIGQVIGMLNEPITENTTAPHGAGRVLSRSKAKAQLSLEEYRQTMEGIYTTSICEATLDEAPFAYKESQEIIDAITDTATVDMIVKPIYNFKAH